MYVARFSYDVLPSNRQRAIEFIQHELEAARKRKLEARLLIPLARARDTAALQFEIELASLEWMEMPR